MIIQIHISNYVKLEFVHVQGPRDSIYKSLNVTSFSVKIHSFEGENKDSKKGDFFRKLFICFVLVITRYVDVCCKRQSNTRNLFDNN